MRISVNLKHIITISEIINKIQNSLWITSSYNPNLNALFEYLILLDIEDTVFRSMRIKLESQLPKNILENETKWNAVCKLDSSISNLDLIIYHINEFRNLTENEEDYSSLIDTLNLAKKHAGRVSFNYEIYDEDMPENSN